MGAYVYGMKAKSFPTPLGPVQASQFIYKPSWSDRNKTPKAAAMLMGRIDAKFSASPPKRYVVGNPADPVWKDSKKPVAFGIHENPFGFTTFLDDAVANSRVVGWLIRQPGGKVTFSKDHPEGA